MSANFLNSFRDCILIFSTIMLFLVAVIVPIIFTRKLFKNRIALAIFGTIWTILLVISVITLVFFTVVLPLSVILGFIALTVYLHKTIKACKLGKKKIAITVPITLLLIYTFTIGSFFTQLGQGFMSPRRYLDPSEAVISIDILKTKTDFKKYRYYAYLGRDTLEITLKEKPIDADITNFIDTIISELENSPKVTENSSQTQSSRLLKLILRYGTQEYFSAQFMLNASISSNTPVTQLIYLTDINVNKLEIDVSEYEYAK